jgi:hypothetical protein
MQALHDLVHSLTKDEKRLYHQTKRAPRLQAIYEGYLLAPHFDRTIDRNIFDQHFQGVSRAFYSMQKRSLMDDILATLLLHTNLQDDNYRYARCLARTLMLLQRRNGEGALLYLQEAESIARNAHQYPEISYLQELKKQAIPLLHEVDIAQYQSLLQEDESLRRKHETQQKLNTVKIILHLLRNASGQPEVVPLATLAAQYMQQLFETLEQQPDQALQLNLFTTEAELSALQNEAEDHHRKLVKWFAQEEKAATPTVRLQMTNLMLQSGLRSGDFLLLSGLIYKINKQLPTLEASVKEAFLPDYYENSSLYHFYENDLATALNENEKAIEMVKNDRQKLVRCIYYRLAMYIAGYLPIQARETIRKYQKQVPELANDPLMQLIEFVIDIESHEPADKITYDIRRTQKKLPKSKRVKLLQDVYNHLLSFLENRATPGVPIRIFPTEWENILRIDLWLEAKKKNQFYYNLLREDWQSRKKVY